MDEISKVKVFDGWHKQYSHMSSSNNCTMRFAIYLPPQAARQAVPVLYWLSGLTCTDENFMQKSGALRVASELGLAIVAPDTSPRGDNVPDDIDGSYDFGLGAGFYLNATQAPWDEHYHMYDYVTYELPSLIQKHFPVSSVMSISGHSMGGHGALSIALKNPKAYKSVSAFSPICNPINCRWGEKAFLNYLGNDKALWQNYDSSVLMAALDESSHIPALVDQGEADEFLQQQLLTPVLKDVADKTNYPLKLRMHEGYDHSYYFISSFISEHLAFHMLHMNN